MGQGEKWMCVCGLLYKLTVSEVNGWDWTEHTARFPSATVTDFIFLVLEQLSLFSCLLSGKERNGKMTVKQSGGKSCEVFLFCVFVWFSRDGQFLFFCRLSSDVLPGSGLVPRAQTRARVHVSSTSPGHTHTQTHIHEHKQTKISVMSPLPTPPPILYLSLWDLKHGNPISLVSLLGKNTLHEACGNLLIPPQLNQGGSAFVYPPEQSFLGISDGFSW